MSAADQRRIHALRVIKELSAATAKANLSECQLESQAFNIKRLLEGFEFFQELEATVRERLPSVVHLVSDRKKGEVLFQEGEAPDRCYILLSGSVSVYKKDEVPDADEEAAVEVKSLSEAKLGEKSLSEASTRCPSRRSSTSSASGGEDVQQPLLTPSELERFRAGSRASVNRSSVASVAAEACKEQAKGRRSAWKRISIKEVLTVQEPPNPWGNNVATLKEGALVGELALLEDKLRSATIVCEDDCDFLSIERADFETVLKSDLARKREDRLKFMREHLPGFRLLPEHKVNKVYYRFRKQTFSKGHVFALQGACAKSQAFLVVDGTVEIRHAPRHAESFGKQDNQVVSTIMPGGLFGSVQQQGDEPFTVVAKTQCNVLFVSGRGLKGLPLTVSHRMDEYLTQVTQARVERCSSTPDVNTSNSFVSCRDTSLMTKQACAKHRARSNSVTRHAMPTASADSTNLVASGVLELADLLSEMKHEAMAIRTPPRSRSRPGTPSRFEAIRSEAKSVLSPSCGWSGSPASTRLPSRSSSRPSTAGSVRSRPSSASSLMRPCASTAGSICQRPGSASSGLPRLHSTVQASGRSISLGGMKRSSSQPAIIR
mmetsp:Transcript_65825/g.116892  ORF Transcript_65825/g.116892 Transcript_65825/m.116892 type:complete len:603 (-) Transcript_65825:154-1962(-)